MSEKLKKPRLTIAEILTWADWHHVRTGEWPTADMSGAVIDQPDETWHAIDNALRDAYRGFPGGSSLAKVLTRYRGKRYPGKLPPLSVDQVLAWARRHHRETGQWPSQRSGPILGRPKETWSAVHHALWDGKRGLPRRSSVAQLLDEHGITKNRANLPRLTKKKILQWADQHRKRTGTWPTKRSGRIPNSDGHVWVGVNSALMQGTRGLPGGSSLARLLVERRGVRNQGDLPKLTQKQVLAWAEAHRKRTGKWPGSQSGVIPGTYGKEKWRNIDAYLNRGVRGLPKAGSIARFLEQKRGARNRGNLPSLTKERILAWADAHRKRTGQWPNQNSGTIPRSGGETWHAAQNALLHGLRGLPGDDSLARLLSKHRNVRNIRKLPRLSRGRILTWAKRHRRRTGKWPTARSGPVLDAPGETWSGIQNALYVGRRALPGGESIATFLADFKKIGKKRSGRLPRLTTRKILQWVDQYHKRHNRWPTAGTKIPIPGAPGESWAYINYSLWMGLRGLPPGSSLSRLLDKHRR